MQNLLEFQLTGIVKKYVSPEQEREVISIADSCSAALIRYHGYLVHCRGMSRYLAVGTVGRSHYPGNVKLL